MTYKIERVGMPNKGDFPFKKLKKGDSFLETDDKLVPLLRVKAVMYSKDKKGTVKFSIRKDNGGYRCYRIK